VGEDGFRRVRHREGGSGKSIGGKGTTESFVGLAMPGNRREQAER